MLVKRVEIENFKRIEKLDIGLSPVDCLVGANNSGKTTLLQALALFDFCIHLCIVRQNGGNGDAPLRIKKCNVSPEEFYVLPVANPLDLWTDRRTQEKTRHRHIKVRVTFDNGRAVTADLDLNFNLYHFDTQSEDKSQAWLQELRDFRVAYLPVFSTFLPQEERRTRAVIEDALVRGSVNSVIRNLLLDLKSEERHTELVAILQRAFPELTDISISFDETSDRFIAVTYRESGRPKEFDIFSSGSGFQQFVYLFGFVTLRHPDMILLDEPDVHLHGNLQNALLDELRNLAANGKQILVATHSREIISRMAPNELLVLDQGMAQRLTIVPEVYDTLDALGSLDQADLPAVQLHRRVLVLENASDKEALFSFCEKILGLAAWTSVQRRLAVCYAKGNPRHQDMERLRSQLQQLLPPDGRPLTMFVIADRDYYPDLEQLRGRLAFPHGQWHVWNRTEIENYLLCPAAFVRALGYDVSGVELHAHQLEQNLEPEMARLIEASRDSVSDKMVKAFEEFGRRSEKKWDTSTLSRKAREYLQEHWDADKLALADAKDEVLPGLNRWLQSNKLGQFSNKRLAQVLTPADLPEEVHAVARQLARFAGVKV